ncbi:MULTISPECIES: MarR family winged helix-turn-helix transcriptional regulator [unclassified Crossiella]|uniref:MarR family winged helix-turn-helix transcriptional regulator n=1 Tax=unclassified Crossiella TaxID=2620835 RepID=UPI001FFF6988|nr:MULTISPECIES: MarR family winged helix-turn-helix transcriptional regulator [unclassified Crossiella]MCK2241657.1 MarR family winged helix-turn-helix transcriptional regulator [Crossiella sp. S99.2]MCK2255471.1 MarR family winged helix-turn-helix transcriptional regulator [Crossiella sp. S99.1]
MARSDDGGPALFRLVRFWSRRWAGLAAGEQRQVQHVHTLEAVHSAVTGGVEPSVGEIAHRLGLDHSGASRLVRDATAAGYLARAESEVDRRRTVPRLTGSGRKLLTGALDWQREAFGELTADWAEADRQRFAGYLQRLAEQVDGPQRSG